MSNTLDIEILRSSAALREWSTECVKAFHLPHRFPAIDFSASIWPVRTLYSSKQNDISFVNTVEAFTKRAESYEKSLRNDISEIAIAARVKSVVRRMAAWRLLASEGPTCLHELSVHHLREIEKASVARGEGNPQSASTEFANLRELSLIIETLRAKKVIRLIPWRPAPQSTRQLRASIRKHRKSFREKKYATLNQQVEALSDATRLMFQRDSRLGNYERSSIALAGLLMSVPSRINEPMCMSINDTVSLNDYDTREAPGEVSEIERAHLLLLQKGSKGAPWSPKPALTFMVDFVNACMQVIRENGARSRMLAEWYEANPSKLFLPAELEHLRGTRIDRQALWKIMHLSSEEPSHESVQNAKKTMNELDKAQLVTKTPNARTYRSDGRRNHQTLVNTAAWVDVETLLLKRVHGALSAARKVTQFNSFQGNVSEMLVLVDRDTTPYLPQALRYDTVAQQFRQMRTPSPKIAPYQTVFEKLGLTTVVDGATQFASIMLHDPRRWLTTQALEAKDGLSDVIINKWANRLNINQLPAYFLSSSQAKADKAAMPEIVESTELSDFSAGLAKLQDLQERAGLRTEMVVAADAGVKMTSMEAIAKAINDRPVARTAEESLVIYLSVYGACLHQAHAAPCRSYGSRGSCSTCNENVVVKGHVPTNEAVRTRSAGVRASVVRQVEKLIAVHNRGIVDEPDVLEQHILALVQFNLNPEEMADSLITEFHEIKDRIKNIAFKKKLEEAFVLGGYVKLLDSPDVASGAMLRYHNPSKHGAPGHERALDAHGGRDSITDDLNKFRTEFPEFAPTALGLKDQRNLLPDDDDSEETSFEED